jgi:phosphoribosyl-AMP cyclohydrolase
MIQEMKIDFEKMDGLVPGIVQDAKTGEVLMLGFLNPASYAKTKESGFVTFWSRTRQKLWMKGETSGNRLRVISASTDCDSDTLLFRVEVEGDGLVCHEGTVSCFTRPVTLSSQRQGPVVADPGHPPERQGPVVGDPGHPPQRQGLVVGDPGQNAEVSRG